MQQFVRRTPIEAEQRLPPTSTHMPEPHHADSSHCKLHIARWLSSAPCAGGNPPGFDMQSADTW